MSAPTIPAMLRALFAALDAVPYAVMRNYETLPETIPGTDIDILVAPSGRAAALRAVEDAAPSVGWRVGWRYAKDYRIDHLVLLPVVGDDVVRIDLMSGVGRRGLETADVGALLAARVEERGVWHLALLDADATLLAGAVLGGRGLQPKYHERLAVEAREQRAALAARLGAIVGVEVADAVLDALARGDGGAIASITPQARRAVVWRAWSRPLRAVRGIAWYARFAVGRVRRPPGAFVVVLGPHGGGKSTIVAGLAAELKPVFPVVTTLHLRPRLLPDLSAIRAALLRRPRPVPGTGEGGEGAPTATGSWTRLLYYALDYVVGYAWRVRLVRMRAGLVVSDRWHYDYAVDQRAKNVVADPARVRAVLRRLPAPDLVILAAPSPETAAARRAGETTAEEAARQVEAFEQVLRACGQPFVRVTTDGPPADAVAEARRAVLDHLAARGHGGA